MAANIKHQFEVSTDIVFETNNEVNYFRLKQQIETNKINTLSVHISLPMHNEHR